MRLKYEAELRRLRNLLNEKDSASRKFQDREMMANRVAQLENKVETKVVKKGGIKYLKAVALAVKAWLSVMRKVKNNRAT